MPAISITTRSETDTSTPIYVCYFDQAQGVVSATNCSLAETPITHKKALSVGSIFLWIFLAFVWTIYGCLLFYYLCRLIDSWFPKWRLAFHFLRNRLLFWRPPPKQNPPVVETRTTVEATTQIQPQPQPQPEPEPGTQAYFDKIKKSCSPDELLIWDQITFPGKIITGFDKVHVPPETVEAVKAFGFPLLNRRSEFAYGVLANNVIPGMLLYGPPGTGKTQLVKALARYCNTTVLSLSGGRSNSRWWGDSERAIASAFMLARKLSPCILFIDEADSMLRKRRDDDSDGGTSRRILSQFLLEWDGFATEGDKPILVVLATNRPSDLDDAILRRAPKRIAVGIPTYKDRVAILKIHLQGERLDTDISIEGIARRTDKFTGSDLKNLCIAAAYACIFEDDAHKTETEVSDQVEDVSDTVEHDGTARVVTTTEDNVDINDEDHGEDIPLLQLPGHTGSTTPSASTLSLSTTDSATTLVSEPPRRLLAARHFEKAIKDITPTPVSKMGMGLDHVFDSGFLKDAMSQPPTSKTTTKRTFAIPQSRVPF